MMTLKTFRSSLFAMTACALLASPMTADAGGLFTSAQYKNIRAKAVAHQKGKLVKGNGKGYFGGRAQVPLIKNNTARRYVSGALRNQIKFNYQLSKLVSGGQKVRVSNIKIGQQPLSAKIHTAGGNTLQVKATVTIGKERYTAFGVIDMGLDAQKKGTNRVIIESTLPLVAAHIK